MGPTVKKETRSYHHGDLRAALIEAALEFLKDGGDPLKLSLRDLALGLGVSQAAPYRHFKDKEELLAAICAEGFRIKFDYMKEAILKNWKNPMEAYFACGEAYLRMGLEHPQHFQLMMSGSVKPTLQKKYPELMQCGCKNFALLKMMIENSQKAGVLGPGNPYLRAMQCWSLVHGFTTLYVEKRFEWLGLSVESAKTALRGLMEHATSGFQGDLPKISSRLKLFGTEESALSLEALKASEAEILRDLFKN